MENNASLIENKETSSKVKTEIKDVGATSKPDQISQKKLKKWKKRMKNQPKSIITLEKEDRPDFYKDLLPEDERDETEMPRTITVYNYINACENEVASMLTATKSHSGSKTALQILPRHLRRRAASHNIKRLPRRLRNLATQQQSEQNEKKDSSKVCRKKRRRNIDLQNEYAERKGKQGWLETHMWHAKRFHMSDSTDPQYSGFESRVPLFPNDKSFRSSYRAVAKHCLIQDVSYLKCLQLSGLQNEVCQLICDITMDDQHNKILTSNVKDGKIESKFLIFDKSKDICVGPASIMFDANKQEDTLSAWLWINPLINKQVLALFEEKIKENQVKISDISDSLIRFRLIGPKSNATLMSVLKPFPEEKIDDADTNEENEANIWLNNDEHKNQISKFNSTMKAEHKRCFSETVVNNPPPHGGAILSLIVNDPRFTLPLQKTMPTFKETTENLEIPSDIKEASTSSKLWSPTVRDQVASKRLPDHIVSTRRNEDKFNVDEEVLTNMATPIPVLLVRRSGFQNAKETSSVHSGPPNNFASGWDLILPHKWGTAFWVPFVYHRCHAGGMRETERCHLECKSINFPRDSPDTKVGQDWWKNEKEKNMKTYYRKPPAKRPNFSVLGSPFPFGPEWEYLADDNEYSEILGGGEGKGLNGVEKKEINLKCDSFEDKLKIDDKIENNGTERNITPKNPDLNGVEKQEIDLKCDLVEDKLKIEDKIENNGTGKNITPKNPDLNGVEKQEIELKCDLVDDKLKIEDKIENNGTETAVNFIESNSDMEVKISGNILLSSDDTRALKRAYECSTEDLSAKKLKTSKTIRVLRDEKKLETLKLHMLGKSIDPPNLSFESHVLIGVTVATLNKGSPTPVTMLCSPSSGDMAALEAAFNDPCGKGVANCQGPTEPKQWDPYRKERKLAKKETKTHKKSDSGKIPKPDKFPVFPTRKIIGFVTSGDFLFSYASGGGIGFVSINQFLRLIEAQRKNIWLKDFLKNSVKSAGVVALMRSPSTSQYRYVLLDVMS